MVERGRKYNPSIPLHLMRLPVVALKLAAIWTSRGGSPQQQLIFSQIYSKLWFLECSSSLQIFPLLTHSHKPYYKAHTQPLGRRRNGFMFWFFDFSHNVESKIVYPCRWWLCLVLPCLLNTPTTNSLKDGMELLFD